MLIVRNSFKLLLADYTLRMHSGYTINKFAFADHGLHWNLSYNHNNFPSLLFNSSLLRQHLLAADKSSAVCFCVSVTVFLCVCEWTAHSPMAHLFLVKQLSTVENSLIQTKDLFYVHKSLSSEQQPGRPRPARLILIDRCQWTLAIGIDL